MNQLILQLNVPGPRINKGMNEIMCNASSRSCNEGHETAMVGPDLSVQRTVDLLGVSHRSTGQVPHCFSSAHQVVICKVS